MVNIVTLRFYPGHVGREPRAYSSYCFGEWCQAARLTTGWSGLETRSGVACMIESRPASESRIRVGPPGHGAAFNEGDDGVSRRWNGISISSIVLGLYGLALSVAADPLEKSFLNPPSSARPSVYWYWISDNISREGITRDLESMARLGIGEAFIGNIYLDEVKPGGVKVLTEPWWELVEHAVREGGRLGVSIGMFNCPGWSQSGGPWVKPQQAMRHLVSSETRVHGPLRYEGKLAIPKEPFQDVAVLAFPAPRDDGDVFAGRRPRVTCTPATADVERLVDGDPETEFPFPSEGGPVTIEVDLDAVVTARSLLVTPAKQPFAAKCELQAAADDGSFRTVRRFRFDRSNMAIAVGPMPRAPVSVAFPAVSARRFRLIWTEPAGRGSLAELSLLGGARLDSYIEKQLGKMHPTPLPMWDTYLWATQAEPDDSALVVSASAVRDISTRLQADGSLQWEVPGGDWIILRIGMSPTGTRNSPASPEGQGLEIDKMNRQAARAHFEAFIGRLLSRMPAAERKAFRTVVADSYEMGSQNWTDGFAQVFRDRYGYDPVPWLPVLTGRLVGSADQSERFLWDLRRLVADHVARDYVGGLRDLCRAHGLQLWLENYGHWGFPAEFLQYGGQSDRIGGEYWVTGDLGSIECRAASSAANTYGKPLVSAESFTGGPPFQNAPWALKARGDWAFCEGINHFVLHVYIQQPWEDRIPGINAPFGTEFNRHNTWFDSGRPWIDYLRRCCLMLQQGTRVADVAYFIGEDAPKMTGVRKPELPAGRDFDYINAEVILAKCSVKDGQIVLPHGTRYRVLVLPEWPTIRPAVLQRLAQLVHAGATVLGPPPTRSPSMEGYPLCDAEVRRIAKELWGEGPLQPSGERRVGQGRMIWGRPLHEIFAGDRLGPDFVSGGQLRFTHRALPGLDIYFVANSKAEEIATTAAFRVTGKAPELWWPDSGRIERPAVHDEGDGCTRVPINLGPTGSVFVVFRGAIAAPADRVVAVRGNREVLLDVTHPPSRDDIPLVSSGAAGSFTMAVWAKPSAETTLFPETNEGVRGLAEPRNDALFPRHGNDFSEEGNHAGCGLAIGRNGVCVFEHGAHYFAPVLVHAVDLVDWTHVAVVYRDGQPSLYLNGQKVRTGLKSRFVVHLGAATQQAGGAAFRGQIGRFEVRSAALGEAEVAGLIKVMPRPRELLPVGAVQLSHGPYGGLEARLWRKGEFELRMGDGRVLRLHATSGAAAMELPGPWQVRFTPGWGAPDLITFDRLEDWTRRPEHGIRYYSGKARYQKTFEIPEVREGRAVWLDLGTVHDLAIVRLNGQEVGTLWLPPWRLEVTSAVKAGGNSLEIEVINTWNNRLAGDAALPQDQRRTFIAFPAVHPDAPLLAAGLLGPVTLQTVEVMRPR